MVDTMDNKELSTKLIGTLYRTARKLWSRTLETGSTEAQQEMEDLEPGDIVCEISTFGSLEMSNSELRESIGHLVEKKVPGTYIIKTLDTKELISWSNARFIKLPVSLDTED